MLWGEFMEYYNLTNSRYVNCLHESGRKYYFKVQLLSIYETVIDEITQDMSLTEQGQICVSNEQLTRRSCTISLINQDLKYLPNPSGLIWNGRKFKLWIGVQVHDNIFWFSQGVFVIQNADSDTGVVTISGIDKGGLLDGSLGYNMTDTNYVISAGVSIYDCVLNTLMLNMGRGSGVSFPVDPIEPIIDNKFKDIKVGSSITVNANAYIGDALKMLADDYCADVYYDANGRLHFTSEVDYSSTDPYVKLANQWTYDDKDSMYAARNISYAFDGINTVRVITNEVNQTSYACTVYNKNPRSPLRVGLVGIKRKNTQEMRLTLNMTAEEAQIRCREYGDYLLMKESARGMQIAFESPIVPHITTNRPIRIKDDTQNINSKFIVQSLTIPLYSGNMAVSATDTDWLPVDTDAWRGEGEL